MLFKNLIVYRVTDPQNHNRVTDDILSKRASVPLGMFDRMRAGWTGIWKNSPQLSLYLPLYDATFLRLLVQEKSVPASVLDAETDRAVDEIQRLEGRVVGRNERKGIKARISEELLPRAFTREADVKVIIDHALSYVYVDSSSPPRAELAINVLRETLGTLPCECFRIPDRDVGAVLTRWLEYDVPDEFSIDDRAKLCSSKGEVSVKNADVPEMPEVVTALREGRTVSEVALTHADRISFVLTSALVVKSIQATAILDSECIESSANLDSRADVFEADVTLMLAEIQSLVKALQETMA